MTPSESELRLSWQLDTKVPWKPDVERHDPLPKFDAHWVMAWGKLTKQQLVCSVFIQITNKYLISPSYLYAPFGNTSVLSSRFPPLKKKIEEAIVQDPMLLKQVCPLLCMRI